ncbi:MAG: hypothetical protein NZM12_05165 [Steroidobacteraceae bacterium]|nr:hypothetical protein [Steroidobacteraceae bacterium]
MDPHLGADNAIGAFECTRSIAVSEWDPHDDVVIPIRYHARRAVAERRFGIDDRIKHFVVNKHTRSGVARRSFILGNHYRDWLAELPNVIDSQTSNRCGPTPEYRGIDVMRNRVEMLGCFLAIHGEHHAGHFLRSAQIDAFDARSRVRTPDDVRMQLPWKHEIAGVFGSTGDRSVAVEGSDRSSDIVNRFRVQCHRCPFAF